MRTQCNMCVCGHMTQLLSNSHKNPSTPFRDLSFWTRPLIDFLPLSIYYTFLPAVPHLKMEQLFSCMLEWCFWFVFGSQVNSWKSTSCNSRGVHCRAHQRPTAVSSEWWVRGKPHPPGSLSWPPLFSTHCSAPLRRLQSEAFRHCWGWGDCHCQTGAKQCLLEAAETVGRCPRSDPRRTLTTWWVPLHTPVSHPDQSNLSRWLPCNLTGMAQTSEKLTDKMHLFYRLSILHKNIITQNHNKIYWCFSDKWARYNRCAQFCFRSHSWVSIWKKKKTKSFTLLKGWL